MRNKDKLYDRIKGALYGVAVGDALGGPVEFMSAEEIRKKHGTVTEMIGGGWLNLKPGEGTDDTAMTLAVAEGILENPIDPVPAIGRRFIEWSETTKDMGKTCAAVIAEAKERKAETIEEWLQCSRLVDERMNGMTSGNGALMRTIYVGLYYDKFYERIAHAFTISSMTHWSEESTVICRDYVEMVNDALLGRAIFCNRIKSPDEPTGYVRNSYICALWALSNALSFEDAIISAVNLGGDADTIGAITGGLAGAVYGYKMIPRRWIAALDKNVKKRLDYLAEVAYRNRKEEEE